MKNRISADIIPNMEENSSNEFEYSYFRWEDVRSHGTFTTIWHGNKVNFMYYFFKLNYNFVILKNINYNLFLYYLFISDLWRN
jgi:hypothetical protein